MKFNTMSHSKSTSNL